MALAAVTLTGTYTEPDGSPIRGWVSFCPPDVLTFSDEPQFVACCTRVQLDEFGRFTVDLVATDAEGGQPEGWVYKVVEDLDCRQRVSRNYFIELPQANTPVDLAQIAPIARPPTLNYIRVPGPEGPVGPPGPGDMTFRGDYEGDTTYIPHDVVLHDGAVWVANAETSAAPPDPSWTLIALQQASAHTSAVMDLGALEADGTEQTLPLSLRQPAPTITVDQDAVSAPVDGLWSLSGRLWATTTAPDPVQLTVNCWVSWVEQGTGMETATTHSSGIITQNTAHPVPLEFSVDVPASTALEVTVLVEQDDPPQQVTLTGALGATLLPRTEPAGSANLHQDLPPV